MPRKLRSSALETRTARLRLAQRKKPYWETVAPGISLGYRRNEGAGSWSVRAADGKGSNWTKGFALADDHEDADEANILTFAQAADKARQLARGGTDAAVSGRPVTVDEALTRYKSDLEVRGANTKNETQVRSNLTPALLAKPVPLLLANELQLWRNSMAKIMEASSVNRMCKPFKAALNLAARLDRKRITNAEEWKIGLGVLPEADDSESNVVISDEQRIGVVAAAYDHSERFGNYVEVHAVTGARSIQIVLLNVEDLILGKAPKLMMPSSLKGKNRTSRSRTPVPISASLAGRLKAAAAGRGPKQPLLVRDGRRWNGANDHRYIFETAARAADLEEGATIYCLRHTSITRALLKGVPIRLVAKSHDTSVGQIEKTYSKFIAVHGDAEMRVAVFDADAPVASNVHRLAG